MISFRLVTLPDAKNTFCMFSTCIESLFYLVCRKYVLALCLYTKDQFIGHFGNLSSCKSFRIQVHVLINNHPNRRFISRNKPVKPQYLIQYLSYHPQNILVIAITHILSFVLDFGGN